MFKIILNNCCGLDVHKTWIYACVGITDSHNRTYYHEARFTAFSKGLRDLCGWLAKLNCTQVCIDMLVIIPGDRGVEDYEEALMDIGYDSLGECGRPDRVFLTKGDTAETAFYVHLTYADNQVAKDQLLFQFIERAVPDIARAYQLVKAQAADEHTDDRRGDAATKAPFIQSVLSAYRLGAKKLEYRGFMGSIEYSEEDGLFYGKVQNTEDLIAYHGEDIVALEQSFKDTVDDYLEFNAAMQMMEKGTEGRNDHATHICAGRQADAAAEGRGGAAGC